MKLSSKKCVPCSEGAPTMEMDEIEKFLKQVDKDWKAIGDLRIEREFEFRDFDKAMEFVNLVADIARAEDHHPNIYIYEFNRVRLELWTHKIGGLHENDFILASKIDDLI